jgi:chemotaxis protein MotB
MREAFGTQTVTRYSGIIEVEGLPSRPKLKNTTAKPDDASDTPTPEERDSKRKHGTNVEQDRAFALAAASLRQALQNLPEISEISKHVLFEQTRDGLNIEIVDQDGRSMFPEGGREPNERTRRLVQRLAEQLKVMPHRVTVTGHTSATRVPPRSGYGPWDLSADRANSVRRILETEGVPTGNIFMVAGRADTQPLFPDDPYIAANRRITITLMREQPPLPPGFQP